MPERPTSRLTFALGLILLAAALIVLPHIVSLSQKEVLVLLVINVLLVSSYRLLTLTGEWSLAHAVIMGVGAYGSALVSKELSWPVPLAMLVGAVDRGLPRLSVELSPVPHEGVLFPDRLLRRRRSHQAGVEVERADLAVRRTQGHQAYSAFPRHPGAVDRFLRSGQLLLSLPCRGDGIAAHSLPRRALAHRPHLPRHSLAGQARRVGRRRHLPLSHAGLRHLVVLRRALRRAVRALHRHGESQPNSAWRR